MHRLTRLIDRKMAKGKQLQAVLFLILQKLLTPTPAIGFILGGAATVAIARLVMLSMPEHPRISAFTFGVAITALAWLFQRVHDNYWEKHE